MTTEVRELVFDEPPAYAFEASGQLAEEGAEIRGTK